MTAITDKSATTTLFLGALPPVELALEELWRRGGEDDTESIEIICYGLPEISG